jgi:hypothetical protein
MIAMKAAPGDRIILRSRFLVRPIRDGEIIEVRGRSGEPPYLILWSDDDRPALCVPGSNAHIMTPARTPRPPGSS